MTTTAWGEYAAERDEARDANPYGTRRIGGQPVNERDVPDEQDLP